MEKLINGVKDFMLTGGQPVSNQPTLIPENRSNLRFDLGLEELKEYKEAVEKGDLVEIADSLGDQLYILLGTALEHGLQDHLTRVFEEIQRSNMTKFHDTEEGANATIMYYEKAGESCTSKVINGKHVVFNKAGKVKKNIHYSPANLEPILKGDQHGFTAEEIKEAVSMHETIEPPHPKNDSKEIAKSTYENAIYLGVKGQEKCKKAIDALSEAFPDSEAIIVFDKDVYNKVGEIYIKKQISWEEQQSMREYTSNPERIQEVMLQAKKVKDACGSIWFAEKNMVENTNMSYKQVKSVMELLFAFGFAAFKYSEKGNKVWKIMLTDEDKIKYLENLEKGAMADADQYRFLIGNIKANNMLK